jgi:hypothetical protein
MTMRTSKTAALAVTALAALAALAGCATAASHPATAATHAHSASPAVAVDPTAACLKLHAWQLQNANTQGGVPPSLARQLQAQTRGTQLGTDITQWLQDLAAPVPTADASAVEGFVSQVASDAAAVGADCDALGVRNTLPEGG